MEQSWRHSVFTLNGTKATRLSHVWGLVVTEPYVLRIHIPSPDGFHSSIRPESQMHIHSLPAYKGRESSDRHIITTHGHLKEAGYFSKQAAS